MPTVPIILSIFALLRANIATATCSQASCTACSDRREAAAYRFKWATKELATFRVQKVKTTSWRRVDCTWLLTSSSWTVEAGRIARACRRLSAAVEVFGLLSGRRPSRNGGRDVAAQPWMSDGCGCWSARIGLATQAPSYVGWCDVVTITSFIREHDV